MKWYKGKSANNSSSYSKTLISGIMMLGVAFAGASSKAPREQTNMLQDIVDNMVLTN